MKAKTLIFTFGLFFPTYRHHCLFDTMLSMQKKIEGSDVKVFIMDDPEELPVRRKLFYLKLLYPKIEFVIGPALKDLKLCLKMVRGLHYDNNALVVIMPNLPYIQEYLIDVQNLPNNFDIVTSKQCYDNLDQASMKRFAAKNDRAQFARAFPDEFDSAVAHRLLAEIAAFYRKPVKPDKEEEVVDDTDAEDIDAQAKEFEDDYQNILPVRRQIDALSRPDPLLRKRYAKMTQSFAKKWGKRFRLRKSK